MFSTPRTFLSSLAAALTFARVAVAAILAVAFALGPTSCGDALNRRLFFDPTRIAQARLGLKPQLREDVRLVLLEDGSLQKLKTHPPFAGWRAVSERLFDIGVERVYLLGIHDAAAPTTPVETNPKRQLIVAAAAIEDAANPRAIDFELVPDRLLGTHRDPSGILIRSRLLGPNSELWPWIDGFGHVNAEEPHRVRAAYRTPRGQVLWAIGLHGGSAPGVPPDEKVVVDFLDERSLAARSLPASAFFARDTGQPVGDLSPKLRERLRGARHVVLVPEAFSGARFVDTPDGDAPSYVVSVAVLNAALEGRLTREAAHPFAWSLVAALLAVFAFRTQRASRSLALSGGVAVLTAAVGAMLLVRGTWYLPVAQMSAPLVTSFVLRVARHYELVYRERVRLSADLALGSAVQRICMPKTMSGRVGRWEWALQFEPHGPMSGDWVQLIELERAEGPMTIVAIGDVVGKGPSAALVTALIAGIFRRHEEIWLGGAEVDFDALTLDLDKTIRATFRGEQYTTLLLAVIEPLALRLASIASPKWIALPPGLAEAGRRLGTSRSSDPLGMRSSKRESERTVSWTTLHEAGTGAVLGCTDGLIESQIDVARFMASFRDDPLPPGEGLARALVTRAATFGKSTLPDDVTSLVVWTADEVREAA